MVTRVKPTTIAQAKWRKRRAQLGGESCLVSNEAAMEHIKKLQGLGWTQKALKEHLHCTMHDIKRRKSIQRETEQRILSQPLVPPDSRGYVQAYPVSNHIKNLITAGWTPNDIAAEAKMHVNQVYAIRAMRYRGRKMTRLFASTAHRVMAIELPPIKSEDVDEVVVLRLVDPSRDEPVPANPAEMSAAIDIVSERFRVNRSTASNYINQRRHLLNERVA